MSPTRPPGMTLVRRDDGKPYTGRPRHAVSSDQSEARRRRHDPRPAHVVAGRSGHKIAAGRGEPDAEQIPIRPLSH